MTAISADHRDFVSSLAKGLAVISAFGEAAPSLTLTEAAQAAGLSRAGARRILLTLESLGYVKNENGRFSPTPRILDLGFHYLGATQWWSIAQPFLEELQKTTGESCSASVLVGDEIVYAAHVASKKLMTVTVSLGTRLPAYCTSMGRVLLAACPAEEARDILEKTDRRQLTPQTRVEVDSLMRELDCVRQQGFAFVDQELERGLRSISVPLSNSRGQVLAALNIGANAQRVTVSAMTTTILDELKQTAAAIGSRVP